MFSLKISKFHITGEIVAKAMSMEQACFIRLSMDNWRTFQETQALDSDQCSLAKTSTNQNRYIFDFLLPVPRDDIEVVSKEKERRSSINSVENNGLRDSTSSISNTGSIIRSSSQPSFSTDSSCIDEDDIDDYGRPFVIEFVIVLRSLGLLYIDDNKGDNYRMKLKLEKKVQAQSASATELNTSRRNSNLSTASKTSK